MSKSLYGVVQIEGLWYAVRRCDVVKELAYTTEEQAQATANHLHDVDGLLDWWRDTGVLMELTLGATTEN
jgi:hypothetical protein